MEQKKKAGLMLVGLAAVIAAIAAASANHHDPSDKEQQQENVYQEVPDGEMGELSSSKSDAYMSYNGSSSNIEDYWDDCEEEFDSMNSDLEQSAPSGGPAVTSEDLFGREPEPKAAKTGAPAPAPRRETAQEREERHQKRREEAIELADEIQKRQAGHGDSEDGLKEESTPLPQETLEMSSGDVRQSEVISTLGDGWDSRGVSTLDEPQASAPADAQHPFKCMFVREEKIKTGQRVSIRLLEDMVIGNVLVPHNSHMMASCNIGQRLELEVSTIEMQGRILSLGYEAYDTDGAKGIYCPDASDMSRTATSRGTSLAGTALRSRVGRVAGDIVSTGITLMENSGGERTVTVPAGYTFFIVKKKHQ